MQNKEITLIDPQAIKADLLSYVTDMLTNFGASGISVDELHSLIETAHLLRSEKNAQRLLRALQRASQPINQSCTSSLNSPFEKNDDP